MAKYDFQKIEQKWQIRWKTDGIFKTPNHTECPKYYVLDMFPYPSGAGLHVGHPLGYIATDIFARYKRLRGYNVLHPMGFDAFGLPAEQYALQTGTPPAITTQKNIARYKEQIELLGLGYDREVWTCDPKYYKWTQWIFLELFKSWYNKHTDKAEPIETLIKIFESEGNLTIHAATTEVKQFTAAEWKNYSFEEQQQILLNYRLAYLGEAVINWCPALGTVLANDEVQNGLSERGGHPVERKSMRQWMLRISAYADRLLSGLETIDWPTSVVDMQKNWIGRSEGASVFFPIENSDKSVEIFTTRPDTIFGATFMVLAPEHPLVLELCTAEQHTVITDYLAYVNSRTERERQSDKQVSGAFTGSYATNPFTQQKIPIWIASYVLYGYGTGAIMAVPGHDSRDYAFAKHFNLRIVEVVSGGDLANEAYESKTGILINSDFLNGLDVPQAIRRAIQEIETKKIGKGKVNYRLQDAVFSRQRYWGEPFPIAYNENGTPIPIDDLPVELPAVESYKPTGTGASPLAAVKDWVNLPNGLRRETDTMPGWAGSSWYFLRYIDPENNEAPFDKKLADYWMPVDLYVGGSEHAVGHLLYARFWMYFLYDRDYVSVKEPFQKLINQGMIQGRSNIAYRDRDKKVFYSANLIQNKADYLAVYVDISLCHNDKLDIAAFKAWSPTYQDHEFISDGNGEFLCDWLVEKMSKSRYNVVNPDELCRDYGADTFRLYEMFLGPLEQSKPWNTNGINGVAAFLRRVYNLFFNEQEDFIVNDEPATEEELRTLHKTIKKTAEDIERLSFNTVVPQFMIFVNEMIRLKCHKRTVLEPFVIILSPFAPHLAEELWEHLGHNESILLANYPNWEEKYLQQDNFEYPISVNGKTRLKINLPLDYSASEVEKAVLATEALQKYIEGKPIKKVIVVPGKIVNLVL